MGLKSKLKNYKLSIVSLAFLWLFFLCFFSFSIKAQSIQLSYKFTSMVDDTPKYFKKEHLLSTKAQITATLNRDKLIWINKGFYAVQFQDSTIENRCVVWVDLGKKYRNIELAVDPNSVAFAPPSVKVKDRNRGFYYFDRPADYGKYLLDLCRYYQNQGYPFANLKFSEFSEMDECIHLKVSVDKGRFLNWSSINVKGDSSISVVSIQQILDIKPNEPFSWDAWGRVDDLLDQTAFIEKIKASELVFTDKGVLLFVYLKSRKISNINGALGLQPDPNQQKMALTGDLQLKLTNTLKRAEQLDVFWRSIKPATQTLNARFVYPYLLRSTLGTESRFSLYKRDSTFLELKAGLNLQYIFNSGLCAKGLFQYQLSNRLSNTVVNTLFPNVTNTKNAMYGLGLSYKRMDYIPNPRKGINFSAEALVGKRRAGTGVIETSTTYKISFGYEQFWPILKRVILRTQVSFESFGAPAVYSNECFRFGGLSTMRGFNEENFLATTKNINQIELRYLLDKNSCFFAFCDQGFFENNSNSKYTTDQPIGFGLGANIGSKAGIFSIVYAIGKELNNTLDFRSGKIHFGYIVYF